MSELYQVLKFYDAPGKPARVQRAMGKLSKADAQRICGRHDSSTHGKKAFGKNWFFGFRRIS